MDLFRCRLRNFNIGNDFEIEFNDTIVKICCWLKFFHIFRIENKSFKFGLPISDTDFFEFKRSI